MKSSFHSVSDSKVVVFTGHMMDRIGRSQSRFAAENEESVRLSIREALENLRARIGFASASCGADTLFLEEMSRRGGATHVVLPYEADDFKKHCVMGFSENPGAEWLPRFEKVWKRATTRTILGNRSTQDNAVSSEFCNRAMLGMGILKASTFRARPTLLTLWDGWSGDAHGGTGSAVKLAAALRVNLYHLKDLHPQHVGTILDAVPQPPGKGSQPFRAKLTNEPPLQICALLFEDVMEFSKLDVPQLMDFITGYMQPLALFIQRARHGGYGPLEYDAWGDGLFCAFDSMLKAATFARNLQKLTVSGKWKVTGSSSKLKLRIALHAGPVFRVPNPIFSKDSFFGTNINFAARLEPITPPGEIYCSHIFAALSASEGIRDYTFKYVGKKRFPKGAGIHPVFLLKGTPGNSKRSQEWIEG